MFWVCCCCCTCPWMASVGVFQIIGWVGIGFGVAFLILAPFIKRWAHGADDTTPTPAIAEDPAPATGL